MLEEVLRIITKDLLDVVGRIPFWQSPLPLTSIVRCSVSLLPACLAHGTMYVKQQFSPFLLCLWPYFGEWHTFRDLRLQRGSSEL